MYVQYEQRPQAQQQVRTSLGGSQTQLNEHVNKPEVGMGHQVIG